MSEEKKFTEDEIKAFLGEKLRDIEPYLVNEFQNNLVFGASSEPPKE